MPYATTNVGGLIVASESATEAQINRELQRLDRNLFLDFENVKPYGVVYIIKEHIHSGMKPLEVLRWQENDGRPKPLCAQMVEELKQQAATRGMDAIRKAADMNRARKERMHAEAREDLDAIHNEHRKRIRGAELDSLPPGWKPKHFGRK